MDNHLILNSIGIGGAIFAGLILFWFISTFLKKRWASSQSSQGVSGSARISWEEKRQHPRLAISWKAAIERSGKTTAVQLKDISLGGAFVVCPDPPSLDEKLAITIDIPQQDPLRLNAKVVWSNRNVPEDRVVNRGMGIKFIENEEEDRRRLNDALTASLEGSEGRD